MNKYFIEIKETLSKIIEIEAESANEAISIADSLYKDSKVILDEYDFVGVEFFDTFALPKEDEIKHFLRDIVDYLYLDEERHYYESNEPINHIFLKLQEIKNFVNK